MVAASAGVLVLLVVLALVIPHGGSHPPAGLGGAVGGSPVEGPPVGSPVEGSAPSAAGHPTGTPAAHPPKSARPTTDASPTTAAVRTPASTVNLAAHKPTGETSHTQQYASGNATDGDADSYWESTDDAFPQWLQVDLGTTVTPDRVVLRLPPLSTWPARTQTLSVLGSADGTSFGALAGSATYDFSPSTGNETTIRLNGSPARFVRLVFTDNSVQHGGQLSELQVY